MPGVQFSLTDFESLLGKPVPRDKDGLNEILAFVKGDVESIEGDAVSIEVKDSNRPDIWSIEGIARSLKHQLSIGHPKPIKIAGTSHLKVIVDKRVKPIRPYISTAIVKGLQPTDESLKGWINLQEKLDQTYGRKRKRASIGFYQSDMIESPLHYTVADPDKTEFVPLGSTDKASLRKIVLTHAKGSEYGDIISRFGEWPLLVDGEDKILSLPPIINSNDLGRITPDTRNVLVEVTGTDPETVHNTLKIVISALAERGGRIYSCLETYPYGAPRRVVSPDLSPTLAKLSLSLVNQLLGTSLTMREASRLAEKAAYRVRRASGDTIHLEIPCYRTDIMHPVDLIEDIAIASDINKLEPEWPEIWTIGDLSYETYQTENAVEVMSGLGFQEVLTYALTSPETAATNVGTGMQNLVTLANPKMATHTVMRDWLLPCLLDFLAKNTHVDYPQKIFEVASTIKKNESTLQPILQQRKVAAVTIHSTAGFTEIRASLDALMRNIDQDFQIQPSEHPSFLSGRCGEVRSNGKAVGIIGEVSPKVLRTLGLNQPTAAFEIELSADSGRTDGGLLEA